MLRNNLHRAIGLGTVAVLVLGVSAACSPPEKRPRALTTTAFDFLSPEAFAKDLSALQAVLRGVSDAHSVVTIDSEDTEHHEIRATIDPSWIAESSTPQEVIAAAGICKRPSLKKSRCILDLVGFGGSWLVLDVSSLKMAELESEIAYARALAEIAGGQITLKVEPNYERSNDEPSYSRFVGVNSCEIFQGESIYTGPCNQDVDWDALQAIPAPSPASNTWAVGRLTAHDSFAPTEVTDLLRTSNALVIPEGASQFAFEDHASIEWFGSTATFGQTVWSRDYLGTFQYSETRAWSKVLEVLGLTIKTPGSSSFGYYASYNTVYEGGTIHFGTCAASAPATSGDEALYDAVLAAGITLPSGSGAGACEAP